MSTHLKTTSNNSIYIDDTRNDNYLPEYYQNQGMGIIYEFKTTENVGINGKGHGVLITITPWHDNTGGAVKQIYISDTGINIRKSSGNQWGSWESLFNF